MFHRQNFVQRFETYRLDEVMIHSCLAGTFSISPLAPPCERNNVHSPTAR